jgi:hypothetical protein
MATWIKLARYHLLAFGAALAAVLLAGGLTTIRHITV